METINITIVGGRREFDVLRQTSPGVEIYSGGGLSFDLTNVHNVWLRERILQSLDSGLVASLSGSFDVQYLLMRLRFSGNSENNIPRFGESNPIRFFDDRAEGGFAGNVGSAVGQADYTTGHIWINPTGGANITEQLQGKTILSMAGVLRNVWHEITHLTSDTHTTDAEETKDVPINREWALNQQRLGADLARSAPRNSNGDPIIYDPVTGEDARIPTPRGWGVEFPPDPPRCFLAGTPVLLADGTERSIEKLRVGDAVMAFSPTSTSGRGALSPRRVTRLFRNTAPAIIDLRGLRMTPGHVCLTDAGRFTTLGAILAQDDVLVDQNGLALRARTGAAVGSPEDVALRVLYRTSDTGQEVAAEVRAGIPCLNRMAANGKPEILSLHEALAERGFTIHADGRIEDPDGAFSNACDWPAGSTPYDTEAQRNWIVRTADGALYAPPWIEELLGLAEAEHAQRVNQAPPRRAEVTLPGSGFRPYLVGSFIEGQRH